MTLEQVQAALPVPIRSCMEQLTSWLPSSVNCPKPPKLRQAQVLLCFGLLRVFFWSPVYFPFASPMPPLQLLKQLRLMDRR